MKTKPKLAKAAAGKTEQVEQIEVPEAVENKQPTGRPSTYSAEIGNDICERIAMGESVRQICLLEDMPDEATFYRWLLRIDGFRENYARAKSAQMERFNEEIVEIADDATNDWIVRENERTGKSFVQLNEEAVSRAKLRIETRKWLMGKHKPKKYGDKVELEHSGRIDSTVTLTEERRSALMERRKAAQIDHQKN